MLTVEKTGVVGWGMVIAARGWDGHRSAGGEPIALCIACFVYSIIITVFSSCAALLNCLYLNP